MNSDFSDISKNRTPEDKYFWMITLSGVFYRMYLVLWINYNELRWLHTRYYFFTQRGQDRTNSDVLIHNKLRKNSDCFEHLQKMKIRILNVLRVSWYWNYSKYLTITKFIQIIESESNFTKKFWMWFELSSRYWIRCNFRILNIQNIELVINFS